MSEFKRHCYVFFLMAPLNVFFHLGKSISKKHLYGPNYCKMQTFSFHWHCCAGLFAPCFSSYYSKPDNLEYFYSSGTLSPDLSNMGSLEYYLSANIQIDFKAAGLLFSYKMADMFQLFRTRLSHARFLLGMWLMYNITLHGTVSDGDISCIFTWILCYDIFTAHVHV